MPHMRSLLHIQPPVPEAPPSDAGVAARETVVTTNDVTHLQLLQAMTGDEPEALALPEAVDALWDLDANPPPFDDPFLRWISELPASKASKLETMLARIPELADHPERREIERQFSQFCAEMGSPLPRSPQLTAAIFERIFGKGDRATYRSVLEECQRLESVPSEDSWDTIMDTYAAVLEHKALSLMRQNVVNVVRRHFAGTSGTAAHRHLLIRDETLDLAHALQHACATVTVLAGSESTAKQLATSRMRDTWRVLPGCLPPESARRSHDIIVINGMRRGTLSQQDCGELIRRCSKQLAPDGLLLLLQPERMRRSMLDLESKARDAADHEPILQKYRTTLHQTGFETHVLEPNLIVRAATPASSPYLAALIHSQVPVDQRRAYIEGLIENVDAERERNGGEFVYPFYIIAAHHGVRKTVTPVSEPPAKPRVSVTRAPAQRWEDTVPTLKSTPTARELHDFLTAVLEATESGTQERLMEEIVRKRGGDMALSTFKYCVTHLPRIASATQDPVTADRPYTIIGRQLEQAADDSEDGASLHHHRRSPFKNRVNTTDSCNSWGRSPKRRREDGGSSRKCRRRMSSASPSCIRNAVRVT